MFTTLPQKPVHSYSLKSTSEQYTDDNAFVPKFELKVTDIET